MARPQKKNAVDKWRNRIVSYGEESVDQLLASARNWRTHPVMQQEALVAVLDEIGIVQNILVNKRTSEQWSGNERGVETVLDGHLRAILSLRHGQEKWPITYVDLTPNEENLLLATYDPLSALATTDREKLAALLHDVQSSNPAILDLLSELGEREHLFPDLSTPSLDDLENEYGQGAPEDLWPEIRVKVPPETQQRYQALLKETPGETDAEKFAQLLEWADEARDI